MRHLLVGRDEVLTAVERYRERDGRCTLIYGLAGVGRTSLAREILARRRRNGSDTHWSTASPASASVPFAAIADLLPRHPQPAVQVTDLQDTRRHLLERATRAPLLLAVDDAHLLDPASLALIHSLAPEKRISLLLTVRSDESVPEEITALWKDGGALRVDLEPLGREASDHMAAAVLDGPAEGETLATLWKLTRGNPMLLREVLLGALELGELTQPAGRWRVHTPLRLSPRLRALLAARLERLGRAGQRGLEALALLEPIALGTFCRLTGSEASEQLEKAGLIEVVRDRRRRQVWFSQPIYGELLRAMTPPTRMRTVAEDLLDLLGVDDRTDPASSRFVQRRGDVSALAGLWREAGRPHGGSLFLAAAREATGLGSHARAAAFAELAVERSGAAAALLVHGEALTYLGHAQRAEQVLAKATMVAVDEGEIVQATLLRFHNQLFNLAAPEEAERIVAAARTYTASEPASDQLDAALAMSAALRGDLARALTASLGVLEREDAHPRTLLGVLVLTSLCRALMGDVTESLRDVRRAEPLLEPLREALPLAADQIGITEVLAFWHDARGPEAISRAQDGYASACDNGESQGAAAWAITLATVLAEAGQFRRAAELCRQGARQLEVADALGLRGSALSTQARCAAALGELPAARSLLHQVEELARPDLRTKILADRARVWLLAADGSTDLAVALALERGRDAIENAHLSWGAMLLHDAVRCGAPDAAVEMLADLAAAHDASLLQSQSRHAQALTQADPAGLKDVAAAFFLNGFNLYAAESQAQAAVLLQAQGDNAAARQTVALAASLAVSTDVASTPALQDTTDPLTHREREVALLAMGGFPSRRIGSHLNLSVRTVDNYLAAVYRKTGIAGRHELDLVLHAG